MARRSDFPARLGGMARLVLDLRLVALLLTFLSLALTTRHYKPLIWLILALAAMTYLPLRRWERVAPTLLRHPAVLFIDVVLAALLLLLAGTDSPFVYFTLCTALLAGALYDWVGAVFFSVLLVAVYWWAVEAHHQVTGGSQGFQMLVGIPALYPIAGAAGAAVRRLLAKQMETESALAAAAERARLAREMHDSVAKTLHGIALQAAALPGWIETAPQRAAEAADNLARDAETAATEARQLITDLRTDSLDSPLPELIERIATKWPAGAGFTVLAEVDDVEPVAIDTRWELVSTLREALRNAERHSGARLVQVGLHRRDGEVELAVTDDGAGFAPPHRLEDLGRTGHFGLLGMSERMAQVGGRLHVHSRPGQGTTIKAVAPAGVAASENGVKA